MRIKILLIVSMMASCTSLSKIDRSDILTTEESVNYRSGEIAAKVKSWAVEKDTFEFQEYGNFIAYRSSMKIAHGKVLINYRMIINYHDNLYSAKLIPLNSVFVPNNQVDDVKKLFMRDIKKEFTAISKDLKDSIS